MQILIRSTSSGSDDLTIFSMFFHLLSGTAQT
jgi:hypothetical protein